MVAKNHIFRESIVLLIQVFFFLQELHNIFSLNGLSKKTNKKKKKNRKLYSIFIAFICFMRLKGEDILRSQSSYNTSGVLLCIRYLYQIYIHICNLQSVQQFVLILPLRCSLLHYHHGNHTSLFYSYCSFPLCTLFSICYHLAVLVCIFLCFFFLHLVQVCIVDTGYSNFLLDE